jgi:tRNA A22 N-methylase
MYTRSEIRNYLQAREFAIKQERLAAEQRAAEMAMAQQQQNNQTMLESAAINNMGASEREQMALESKENIEAAKLAMKEQEMAQE